MQKLNLGWLLSIERLSDLTAKDQARVVRPVSPRIVIRSMLLDKKSSEPAPTGPRRRRRAR